MKVIDTFWKPKKFVDFGLKDFPKKFPARTKTEIKVIDRNPYGDADRDKVMNWFDCKPLDKKKQGFQHRYSFSSKSSKDLKTVKMPPELFLKATYGQVMKANARREKYEESKKRQIEETESNRARRIRHGATRIVTIDAAKFKEEFERQNREELDSLDRAKVFKEREKLGWNKNRLKSALSRNKDDAYPEVTIKGNRIDVEDGRHRISAAAKKGQKIDVALTSGSRITKDIKERIIKEDKKRIPSEFENATFEEYKQEFLKRGNIPEKMRKITSREEHVAVPFLTFQGEGLTEGHEGRHTAAAAIKRGLKVIPVTIEKTKGTKLTSKYQSLEPLGPDMQESNYYKVISTEDLRRIPIEKAKELTFYHGTSKKSAKNILNEGLKAQKLKPGAQNYKIGVSEKERMEDFQKNKVFLTPSPVVARAYAYSKGEDVIDEEGAILSVKVPATSKAVDILKRESGEYALVDEDIPKENIKLLSEEEIHKKYIKEKRKGKGMFTGEGVEKGEKPEALQMLGHRSVPLEQAKRISVKKRDIERARERRDKFNKLRGTGKTPEENKEIELQFWEALDTWDNLRLLGQNNLKEYYEGMERINKVDPGYADMVERQTQKVLKGTKSAGTTPEVLSSFKRYDDLDPRFQLKSMDEVRAIEAEEKEKTFNQRFKRDYNRPESEISNATLLKRYKFKNAKEMSEYARINNLVIPKELTPEDKERLEGIKYGMNQALTALGMKKPEQEPYHRGDKAFSKWLKTTKLDEYKPMTEEERQKEYAEMDKKIEIQREKEAKKEEKIKAKESQEEKKEKQKVLKVQKLEEKMAKKAMKVKRVKSDEDIFEQLGIERVGEKYTPEEMAAEPKTTMTAQELIDEA